MTDPVTRHSALQVLEAQYYTDLDRFVQLGHELTAAGQPYLTILLCHELYRFLYPVEPYAGFRHTDPVPFLCTHLQKLITLGTASLDSIRGYPPAATRTDQHSSAATNVETSTSDLYSQLWLGYDSAILTDESRKLVARRLPPTAIEEHIVGRRILDLGCGSGRYSIALAVLGAAEVTAVDYQAKSYARTKAYCEERGLPVTFQEADVLALPFADGAFDFVFSNGVLHHTRSWQRALDEYFRVMGRSGFLYLYATGGFFWTTRRALRPLFENIPRAYTSAVLEIIGMPSNRMIFMDTWYVPIEDHIPRRELETAFERQGVQYEKLTSDVDTDLDYPIAKGLPGASIVWGEGEHRYLLARHRERTS